MLVELHAQSWSLWGSVNTSSLLIYLPPCEAKVRGDLDDFSLSWDFQDSPDFFASILCGSPHATSHWLATFQHPSLTLRIPRRQGTAPGVPCLSFRPVFCFQNTVRAAARSQGGQDRRMRSGPHWVTSEPGPLVKNSSAQGCACQASV